MKPGLRMVTLTLTGLMLLAGTAQAASPLFAPSAQKPVRLVLNQDQLEGMWKQFKGELKQKWAEFTDDDLMLIEGRIDKLEGKIQERYGDRREEVKRWVDEWFETHGESARQS